MSEGPERKPEEKSGRAWLIGFGALFVGYLLGHNSAPATPQPAYVAETNPSLESLAAADAAAVDMNAIDVNAPAMNGDVGVADPDVDAVASATDSTAGASASTSPPYYQPTYAYAPTPDDADDSPVETASAADDSDDTSWVASTGTATQDQAASPVSTYSAPHYGYSTPSVGYASSTSKCVGIGCYGTISTVTGLPRTTYVHGYTRRDGTYVQPYYRSHRH